MLDGIIVLTPSPCKLSGSFSIAGKGGFRILSISLGKFYKASFILAEFKPFLCLIE